MKSEQNLNSDIETKNEVYTDEFGNPVQTQYVDEFGNPIDPSLIDELGNYIGNTTQYVDEFGNPIDPSLIDEFGNYIGETPENGVTPSPIVQEDPKKRETKLANELNELGNFETLEDNNLITGAITEPISASARQMEGKEILTGMVTFDYNNVPITDIVNSIILDAINKGASDIHFDPFDNGIKIRVRIDGQLNDYSIVPLFVKKNMITRIKIISGMNITESRVPQDGAIRTELQNKTVDLRVSCLPTNMGEKIVIRIMDYSMSAAGIEALDFSEENLAKVRKMLALPNGIILVTGATGTGKSTTVYSMLQKLNVEGTNLVTVEDPIEMNIGGINQVQAVSEIGLSFATVLRSVLRQDPDVIMIGEIRDDETARIAVRASITGHLVLSTIHTNNSLNTIERLTDMSVERYLLGSSLEGIVSQKLSRRLCDKCKRLRPTTDYEKDVFKQTLNKEVAEIYEPVGCSECSHGYRGRIAIHEVLLLNQKIKDAITQGVPKEVLRNYVYSENGTTTMLQDGLEKVLEGRTSFAEILKLIDLEDDLGTGSQLGLNEQLNASGMNMMNIPNMNINPTFAPNMMPMYVPYPMANYPELEEDEEIVIKPKRKKKKTVVEIDPDELKEMLDDSTDEKDIKEEKENIDILEDEVIEELEELEEINDIEDIKEIEEIETLPEEEMSSIEEVVIEEINEENIETPATMDAQKDIRELIDTTRNMLEKLYNTKKIVGKKKFNVKVQELLTELEPTYLQLKEIDQNFRFDDKTENDIKDLIHAIALNITILKNDTEISLYKNTLKRINDVLGIMAADVDIESYTQEYLDEEDIIEIPEAKKEEEIIEPPMIEENIDTTLLPEEIDDENLNDEKLVSIDDIEDDINISLNDEDLEDYHKGDRDIIEIKLDELDENDINIVINENEDDITQMIDEEFNESSILEITPKEIDTTSRDLEEIETDKDLDDLINDKILDSLLSDLDI